MGTLYDSLTNREQQVLEGMANGKSNAEIGKGLGVSEDTVKTHARRIFKKLGASNRAHAVYIGYVVDGGPLEQTDGETNLDADN